MFHTNIFPSSPTDVACLSSGAKRMQFTLPIIEVGYILINLYKYTIYVSLYICKYHIEIIYIRLPECPIPSATRLLDLYITAYIQSDLCI